MSSDEAFLTEVLAALRRTRLEAVVVGNTAAALWGAPVTTLAVDLLARESRLTSTRIRALSEALDAVVTRPSELAPVFTLVGGAAPVDVIVGHIAGELRFERVKARAHSVVLGPEVALVADLADVIRSKEAAGRPKDLAVLPILRATLAVRSMPAGGG